MWCFFHTGLAGGNMAARSPSILSLEHSEKTCSWREAWGSFPSASLRSDNTELNVPGPPSEADREIDALQFQEINARYKLHSQPQIWVQQSALFHRAAYFALQQERGGLHWTLTVSGWGWESPVYPGPPVFSSLHRLCLGVMTPPMVAFSPHLRVYSLQRGTRKKWGNLTVKNTF